jgi:hypothetical protein
MELVQKLLALVLQRHLPTKIRNVSYHKELVDSNIFETAQQNKRFCRLNYYYPLSVISIGLHLMMFKM